MRPGNNDDKRHDSPGIGQDLSFSELITREQDFLLALIRTIGVPRSDAGDVLQDANLYLIENQEKYEAGTNFRAWAAQVVRYRTLGYFRSKGRSKMTYISDEAIDSVVAETVDGFDLMEARLPQLRHCMKKLDGDQAELLRSVYTSSSTLKELAALGGQSHSAVRKTVSRIRQKLKLCIENASTNPDE